MKPKTIGGVRLLDKPDLPIGPTEFFEEVIAMSRQGLSTRDISQALNLHPAQVEQILEEEDRD
jgi:plasmid maintenance system antidote protein VapI